MEKLTEILKQAFFKNKTGKELLLCKKDFLYPYRYSTSHIYLCVEGLGFTEICSPNQTWHTEAIIKPNDFVGIGIFNKKDPWVTNSSVRVVPMDSQKYIMFTEQDLQIIVSKNPDMYKDLLEYFLVNTSFMLGKCYLSDYPNTIQSAYVLLNIAKLLERQIDIPVRFPSMITQRRIASLARASISKTSISFQNLLAEGLILQKRPIVVANIAELEKYLESHIN